MNYSWYSIIHTEQKRPNKFELTLKANTIVILLFLCFRTGDGQSTCAAGEYMCGDRECILQELVCNNEVDCNDGLDEYRCGELKTQQAAICLLKNATIFCRLMIKITYHFYWCIWRLKVGNCEWFTLWNAAFKNCLVYEAGSRIYWSAELLMFRVIMLPISCQTVWI